MLLTFIVPFYNIPEKFVLRNVNSFENQKNKYEFFEVLFINDASTKKHLKILQNALKGKKFTHKIINKKNNGNWGSCVNLGHKLAKGDFLGVIDGDDAIEKDSVKKIVEKIKEIKGFPNPAILMSEKSFDNESNILHYYRNAGKHTNLKTDKNFLSSLPFGRLIWQRKMLKKLELPENFPFTDWFYIFSVLNETNHVFGTSAIYIYHIMRPGNSVNLKIEQSAYYSMVSQLTDLTLTFKIKNPYAGKLVFWYLLLWLSFKESLKSDLFKTRKNLFLKMMKKNRAITYGSKLKGFFVLFIPKRLLFWILVFILRKSLWAPVKWLIRFLKLIK